MPASEADIPSSPAPLLPPPQAQPIRVIPILPPPRPISPPFERLDDWEPAGFPWPFTVKVSLGALLVSIALTSMLLFGVTVWSWTRA